MQLFVENEQAMEALGAKIASQCKGGELIVLKGQLGAGKTTLVRGFLKAVGHEGKVKSPTYTLVETYLDHIHHFDLYRLNDPQELELIGFRDYFHEKAINLIEWPEKAGDLLPKPDIIIEIEMMDANKRKVNINPS
jgi:tRNA threonylcarbamoyladenosine biosynthesis protein TsaE